MVYSYAPGRSGEIAAALLKGYSGVLQTDGYTAYSKLADPKQGGSLQQAFCWAHWRRQWFDLAKSPPAARQERSKPLITAMKAWLEKMLAQLPGSSPPAQIIRYGLSRWDGFTLFLDDGRVEIDSNPSSAASVRLFSPERMHSSPAAARVPKTGQSWRR